jgi:hypothetical protein
MTVCTERHWPELRAQAAGESRKGLPEEGAA